MGNVYIAHKPRYIFSREFTTNQLLTKYNKYHWIVMEIFQLMRQPHSPIMFKDFEA